MAMPYTIGLGYTTAEIKCYPLASEGPTVVGGMSWGFGAWVQVVPANIINVDFMLLGITCFIDPTETIDDCLESLLEVGVGAAGSESTIVQIPFTWFIDSAAGHCMEQVIPIMPPRKIPANSRVAIRIASGGLVIYATFGGCKIQYVEALDTYTDELIKSYPALADGVEVISSSTSWAWGSWVQLVPANAITNPFDIHSLAYFDPWGATKDLRYQGVIQLGIGAAGSEVPIISLAVHSLPDSMVNHIPEKQIYTLPVPRRVPANSRVAVRIANDGNEALWWRGIKIRYVEVLPVEKSADETFTLTEEWTPPQNILILKSDEETYPLTEEAATPINILIWKSAEELYTLIEEGVPLNILIWKEGEELYALLEEGLVEASLVARGLRFPIKIRGSFRSKLSSDL